MQALPLILEPAELRPLLGSDEILVLDLSRENTHRDLHIPGARFLDYAALVEDRPPASGLLPAAAVLAQRLGDAGIGPDTRVVAYDDEGGGKAARLIWTLHALGHRHGSLLNGGLQAWANERQPLDRKPARAEAASFHAATNPEVTADAEYILSRLDDPGLALLDARSAEEYTGARRFSARPGRIPGAVNLDWTEAMDRTRNLRMKPADRLTQTLAGLGVTPDKEVVVYCQTHHRSSYLYVALKALGFERVRGYPGSWSDWGNRLDLPTETG